jgi:hypothetical protein
MVFPIRRTNKNLKAIYNVSNTEGNQICIVV